MTKSVMLHRSWLLLGGLFFFAVVLSVVYFATSFDLCANTEIVRYGSPGGAYEAVVFQRDCGATTGFSTQVSIRDAGWKLPNDGGNIFVTDTNHGATPSGPSGGPEVRVEWLSDDEVLIRHHKSARVFRQEQSFGSVTILYELLE